MIIYANKSLSRLNPAFYSQHFLIIKIKVFGTRQSLGVIVSMKLTLKRSRIRYARYSDNSLWPQLIHSTIKISCYANFKEAITYAGLDEVDKAAWRFQLWSFTLSGPSSGACFPCLQVAGLKPAWSWNSIHHSPNANDDLPGRGLPHSRLDTASENCTNSWEDIQMHYGYPLRSSTSVCCIS
jgi:hypothetical protein